MRTAGFDRDHALDVVMGVFWEKGYNDSSIHDLTVATGLQRSSLYNTFAGKRELYLAAMRRYHERCSEQYAALDCAADPAQAIRDLVQSVITDELSDTRGTGCMVANAALEFSGRDAEIRDLTAHNLAKMSEAIRAAITRAQRLGHVDETVDATAAAQTIIVTIQGLRVAAKAVSPTAQRQWLTSAADSCLAVLRR